MLLGLQERAFLGTAKALGWKVWCEADKVRVRGLGWTTLPTTRLAF